MDIKYTKNQTKYSRFIFTYPILYIGRTKPHLKASLFSEPPNRLTAHKGQFVFIYSLTGYH